MKFASAKQIVILTLAWTVALFVADYAFNPRPIKDIFANINPASQKSEITATKATKPQLVLWMNHLCCSGCLSDVQEALKKIPWLGPADILKEDGKGGLPSIADADKSADKITSYANKVKVDIKDVNLVDFVVLDGALRAAGPVAERIELSGVPHYRLVAELPHICCSVCAKALGGSGGDLPKLLRGVSGFRWIDSASINKQNKTVTVYVKLNETADIVELTTGLNKLGYAPRYIRLLTTPEK